jgi:hypothetical protein
MNPMELSDVNFALYINKIHYLNATKRYEITQMIQSQYCNPVLIR